MKRIILLVLLAATLGGCAQTQRVADTVQALIVGVENPITKQELYAFENGMIIAFAGLNAYKRACLESVADVNCRANIRAMQVYTRKLPAALTTTRRFVRENDQVNARVAYTTLKELWNNFRAEAAAANIRVQ